jgi:hypothetical protein
LNKLLRQGRCVGLGCMASHHGEILV